jgi:uncharacterized membrane protein YidH (DUF202 family)
VRRRPRDRPGLQAERTRLAWERSAIGFLANGALALLKQSGPLAAGGAVLAVMAVALGLLVLWLGRRRGRRIETIRVGGVGGERRVVSDARTEVLLIGWATAGFAVAVVAVFLFPK